MIDPEKRKAIYCLHKEGMGCTGDFSSSISKYEHGEHRYFSKGHYA